ncbi:MAG: HAD-IB family hydrolase [Burkholderiales bacterium]
MTTKQRSPKPERIKVALFDLDHTLLPIDSDHGWGAYTTELGWTDAVDFTRRNDEFFAQYKAGALDIDAYVRFATEAIRLQGASKSIAARAGYTSAIRQKHLKIEALELVQRHRAAGDRLAVVTATNEFVTRPLADLFGIQDLIAVRLERDAATGWITGAIEGTPSVRGGKVTRVEQWLAEAGFDWSDVESTFYSDSVSDLPLLEKVDHPIATNPDDRLRDIARERGWPVLDLFKKI